MQRVRVLEVAERLVGTHGFSKVRLRDIAREAGLSIGALQHHFETRDQLLKEAFLWSCEQRLTFWRQTQVEESDPWRRLQSLLSRVFEVEDFRLYCAIWAEYSAAAARDEDLRTVMADLYEQWRVPLRDVIQEGIDAGAFTPIVPVEDVTNMLAAQIDGLEVASIIAPSGMEQATLPTLLRDMAAAILQVGPERA